MRDAFSVPVDSCEKNIDPVVGIARAELISLLSCAAADDGAEDTQNKCTRLASR